MAAIADHAIKAMFVIGANRQEPGCCSGLRQTMMAIQPQLPGKSVSIKRRGNALTGMAYPRQRLQNSRRVITWRAELGDRTSVDLSQQREHLFCNSSESQLLNLSTRPGDIYRHPLQRGLDTINSALRSYFKEVRTGWNSVLKGRDPAAAFGRILETERKMIYLMTCNDVSSAILPYWCMGINILAVSPFIQTADWDQFWVQATTTMSKEVLYSFFYLYSFNLANQYKGAAGDAIDKPWRPIPAGLITREGALARCFLTNLLYTFVSWHLGVLPWTLLWQCIIASQFFGYETDKSSRGVGRSIAMWVGTVVMCSVGVSLATPMTPTLQFWAVARGASSGNHHWMQDFRDVDGDQKVGRITFPLLFGVENARKLMAFIFFMDPVFLHFVVMKDSGYSTPQLIAEGLGALLSAALAYRVMNCRTPAEDHDTYTFWLTTYWHNVAFLLVGPAFVLGSNF